MRIEISLALPSGCRDVAITAAGSTPVAAVRRALAGAVDADELSSLWIGSRELSDSAALGASGLRTGGVIGVGRPGRDPAPPGLLELQVVGGARSGAVFPLRRGRLTIGRAPDNTVVLTDDRASRRHAVIEVGASEVSVRDLGSTNGTWVDGAAVPRTGAPIRAGQIVRIAESLFGIEGGPVEAQSMLPGSDGAIRVHRAPRAIEPSGDVVIELPQRTQAARPGRVQWITALLPAALGAGIAIALDAPQFLLFALLSPVMVLSGALGDRAHWRRSRRRLAARHRAELAAAERRIAHELTRETLRRRRAAPDPPAVHRVATIPTSRLWERRPGDADHLAVRVGSAVRRSDLQTLSGSVTEAAGTVPDVPVVVDLRAGPLGLVGRRDAIVGLARWVIVQLAALHSPTDVDVVLLMGSASAPTWHWARWLPHLRRPIAVGTDECARVVADLRSRLDVARSSARGSRRRSARWTVIVVDGDVAGTPGLAALLDAGTGLGVTGVCLADRVAALPGPCSRTVRVDDAIRDAVTVCADGFTGGVVIDQVPVPWVDQVARSLAPLVDVDDSDEALPAHCRLVDLLGLGTDPVDAVLRAWDRSDGGATAVIGVTPDGPARVDLVRDGPHALVAGTTGSGKSELLRTLVAGMAAAHPPDQLTFLLVDYKGGAAFGECTAFPHTAALVTDLDAQLTRRALRSLHAELRRRERLFTTAGVRDFAGYRDRCGPGRVARLVIAVDEFATLADDLPDFVEGLVGVARRGRSLGVHLILATQRPGGVVSAEIRANTSLRIALRVTDPVESTDVVDVPDAAHIESDRPGRAWLRTGSTLTCFQSALTGGHIADPDTPVVELLDDWRRPHVVSDASVPGSDLGDLAALFVSAARQSGRGTAVSPWCAPLPTVLALDRLRESSEEPAVAVGLVDLPDEQEQPPLTVDLDCDRSLLIVGRSRAGRTTALATVVLATAARAGPAELEIYLVDGAGELADDIAAIPHLATCLGPSDVALVSSLLDRLGTIIDARARGDTARDPARLMLVLDGWDRVLAELDDLDTAQCVDRLGRLMRAGSAARLTVVAAGDRSLLMPRYGVTGFAARYLLELSDRSDFGAVGISARDVPASMPPGRGLRASDGAFFQFAHAGSRPGADQRRAAADEVAARWRTRSLGPAAVRLRPLPRTLRLESVAGRGPALTIGVAGDLAQPCAIDLLGHRARLLVAGPPRSGKSTTLTTILVEAHRAGVPTIAACSRRSPLHAAAGRHGVPVITPGDAGGPLPATPTLLIVDDSDAFVDGQVADDLAAWVRRPDAALAVVVAGRSDDVAGAFRGVAADVRRHRCGLLLRPGRVDGDLLGQPPGTRLGAPGPPGRGVLIGDPRWGPMFAYGTPLPIQVAQAC